MPLKMVTIVSSFYIESMRKPFSYLLNYIPGINKFQFIYNQIHQEISLENSYLNSNRNGINVILLRISDLVDFTDSDYNENILENNIKNFLLRIKGLVKKLFFPLTIIVCPEKKELDNNKLFKSSCDLFLTKLQKINNIRMLAEADIKDYYSVSSIHNVLAEKQGHTPYALEYFAAISLILGRTLFSYVTKPHKVIVLDCDNTLWDGIVGEDGLDGIRITHTRQWLQQFFINQYKNGVLLCLCSKNNRRDVLNVFSNFSGMLLDIKAHIVSYRINWEPKSKNIISLAEELDLNLDSFIFIDDNPMECEEVKTHVPEVLVIQLPRGHDEIIKKLKSVWAFDHRISGIHADRTRFYKSQYSRKITRKASHTFKDFIKSLQLKVVTARAIEDDIIRISELTVRTNQFNLNPEALTVEKIKTLIDSSYECLTTQAEDKFGDYGIVGVLIIRKNKKSLIVKTFLLSCRALNKGIEYEMLQYLIAHCVKSRLDKIIIQYIKNEKNLPAQFFVKHLKNKTKVTISGQKLIISMSSLNVDKVKPEEYIPDKNTPTRIVSVRQPNVAAKIQALVDEINSVDDLLEKIRPKKRRYCSNYNTQGEIEKKVVAICQSLSCCPLTRTDNFVGAGVDSLVALELIHQLYVQFGIEINYNDLLQESSNIASIVARIRNRKQIIRDIQSCDNQKDKNLPLSYYQHRLWLDEQINKHPYHISIGIALSGKIVVDYLKQAFIKLFQRHRIFTIKIKSDSNGDAYQQMVTIDKLTFSIEVLTHLNNKNQVRTYFRDFSEKRFQLDKPPFLRVALIRLEENYSILCICIHHIIHDGQSLSIILGELSEFYNGCFSADSATHLSAASECQYLDFVFWQKNKIEKDRGRSLKYWKKLLRNLHDINLIYDFSASEKLTYRSKRTYFKLNATLSHELLLTAKKYSVTLYTLLLSSCVVLLSKYGGAIADIPIVIPVSVRDRHDFNKMVGLFVNLNILRFTLKKDQCFSNFLDYCNGVILQSYMYYDFPFELISKEINLPRDANNRVMFNAGFSYQNYSPSQINFFNTKSQVIFPDKNDVLYDTYKECRFSHLTLYLRNINGQLHGIVEYNTALFKRASISNFIRHFSTLLENIVASPEEKISELSLIDVEEKKAVLRFSQGPVNESVSNWGLLDSFNEQLAIHAKKIAIKDGKISLSYEELNEQSSQLALYITEKYSPPSNSRIAICMEKGIHQIIAFLATIKLSCAYIPIDSQYTDKKLNAVIIAAAAQLILTDKITHKKFTTLRPPALVINLSVIQLNKYGKSYYSHSIPPALAYIIFTSGSTGEPKGIMITQHAIIRLVKGTHYINIEPSDTIAHVSNISFDASTFEIWGALLNGATLAICNEHKLLDANEFHTFLKAQSIDILFITTELLHRYAGLRPALFSSLKYLIFGGDVLNKKVIDRILKLKELKPKHIIHAYGPSENTTFSTTFEIIRMDKKSTIPIGRPIDGTNAYIIDDSHTDDLKLTPIGLAGKLYVSGKGLMQGYLLTSKKQDATFIVNPFVKKQSSLTDHQLLYDTGDYARWRADGNIEYLGRKDNQVKVRGFRINLQHIENVMLTHPEVMQAAAVVKQSDSGDKQIIVFFTAKSDKNIPISELSRYLKSNLFSPLLPDCYIKLDNLPMNKNRKIDRKALLEKFPADQSIQQNTEPTETITLTATECLLRKIFSRVLHRDEKALDVNIDFFALGGNSLTAIELLHLIEKEFRARITYQNLFNASSIRKLSDIVKKSKHNDLTVASCSKDSFLIKLKEGSDPHIVLVFIHPVGGTVFCYQSLIKQLETPHACYAFQDPSIHVGELVFDSIEEMAKNYSAILKRRLPNCAYVLCGYSFGGILSLEMAHYLKNKVRYVFLFDTWIVSKMTKPQRVTLHSIILKKFRQFKTAFVKKTGIDPGPWLKLYYHRMQHLGFSFHPHRIESSTTKVILFKGVRLTKAFLSINDPTNYVQSCSINPVIVHPVDASHDTILNRRSVIRAMAVCMLYHILEGQ